MMAGDTAEIRNYYFLHLATLPYLRLYRTCENEASQKLQRESHKVHLPLPEELLKLMLGKGESIFFWIVALLWWMAL